LLQDGSKINAMKLPTNETPMMSNISRQSQSSSTPTQDVTDMDPRLQLYNNVNVMYNSNNANVEQKHSGRSKKDNILQFSKMPRKKKCKDKPKRPLSAYNLFFRAERTRILESLSNEKLENTKEVDTSSKDNVSDETVKADVKQAQEGDTNLTSNEDISTSSTKLDKKKKTPHGKIGFENLAKTIGQRWSKLIKSELEFYRKLADQDMKRYKDEMEIYIVKQQVEATKAVDKAEKVRLRDKGIKSWDVMTPIDLISERKEGGSLNNPMHENIVGETNGILRLNYSAQASDTQKVHSGDGVMTEDMTEKMLLANAGAESIGNSYEGDVRFQAEALHCPSASQMLYGKQNDETNPMPESNE